jgi:hypothetical protein
LIPVLRKSKTASRVEPFSKSYLFSTIEEIGTQLAALYYFAPILRGNLSTSLLLGLASQVIHALAPVSKPALVLSEAFFLANSALDVVSVTL